MARYLALLVATFATPWLIFAETTSGSWTRFGAGVIVAVAAVLFLRRELRADQPPRRRDR